MNADPADGVRESRRGVRPPDGSGLALSLSPREMEVLDLASHGMTNAEIARRLRLSVHAVKFHLASIYRKLRVTNRTEAAFAYLLVRPPGGLPADPAEGS